MNSVKHPLNVKSKLLFERWEKNWGEKKSKKKENPVLLHKSGPAQQLHQNVIWKVEANVYLVNKLSSSAASSQLFQACKLRREQTHMLLRSSL